MIDQSDVQITKISSPVLYEIGTAVIDIPFVPFVSPEAINCKLTPWVYTARLEETPTDGAAMSSYVTLNVEA